MAEHRRPAPARRRGARVLMILIILVVLLAAAGTGVYLFLADAGPQQSAREENFREPDVPPEFFPDGSAADNLPYFSEVLRVYAVGDDPVEGRGLVDAVVESGFDRTAMQVSFDRTKTGLVADNIFVSVLIGRHCLIGQMVVEDRTFVAETAPAIGPGRDLCLIGETREIDWDPAA
ncbi:hypothetical protein J4H92_08500 [Leucobacter weissii]|uniref:DUF6993 domain-containing protein n=1 Tax=Leucobacter weissii TaxID=1983706 RepID=A0A939MNT1_9MICO|nr:hypothetical protein [Leucobacter weissii]MBO1901987.1 hypothetical protein [Leucobacter weissii]